MKDYKELVSQLSFEVKENYPLAKQHCFKKKTGNAKYFCELKFDDTLDHDLEVLSELYSENLPFVIFAMGTNLMISEKGYGGLFCALSKENSNITFDKKQKCFIVSANTTVAKLVNHTKVLGYDFSALAGIPGMVGAGVFGNAGWNPTPSKKEFSDFVKSITVFDFKKNAEIVIAPDKSFFSKRDSFLKQANREKTRYFIKSVMLHAENIGKEKVEKLVDEQIEKRKENLKISFKEGTAGSLFSHWHLKRQAGKTMKDIISENPDINIDINGATFSANGARQFKTEPHTTDKDVAKFLYHIVVKIKEYYGIELHKEVFFLDHDGEIDLETFIKKNVPYHA